MTDLHTHILPQMDDGSRDVLQSIEMLRLEWAQGVRTVALTSHYYPEQESAAHFLSRRQEAYEVLSNAIAALPEEKQMSLPRLALGAEVAWVPGLADIPDLEKLCYEGSKYLLTELPFCTWSKELIPKLIDLMNRTGLTPVIAHVDRYLTIESKKHMEQLFELGLPVQISAAAMTQFLPRRALLPIVRSGAAQLLISDCHNMTTRRPNLDTAYAEIRKKCGEDMVQELKMWSNGLLKTQRESI